MYTLIKHLKNLSCIKGINGYLVMYDRTKTKKSTMFFVLTWLIFIRPVTQMYIVTTLQHTLFLESQLNWDIVITTLVLHKYLITYLAVIS